MYYLDNFVFIKIIGYRYPIFTWHTLGLAGLIVYSHSVTCLAGFRIVTFRNRDDPPHFNSDETANRHFHYFYQNITIHTSFFFLNKFHTERKGLQYVIRIAWKIAYATQSL